MTAQTTEVMQVSSHKCSCEQRHLANEDVSDHGFPIILGQERIYEIHRAVARGRLRDVQALLDRKKLALARDPLGATPLHKAVMYGHRDIVEYIAMNFPLSKDTKDLVRGLHFSNFFCSRVRRMT
ncbi:ANK_REP_REGION domain-containing protein [Trichonephila clavipes]|nr:ANK_REP_REGION domain-containing protein [Trichonephila clavipes]